VILRPNVVALLVGQFWVAATEQLIEAGMSASSVDRARRRDELHTVVSGVLQLAHTDVSFHSRAMALQLHAGPASYLSGPTAGALYGMRGMSRRIIHITTYHKHRPTMPAWGRLHRTSWVDTSDTVLKCGELRVPQPLPMLFDLAGRFNQHRFERVAEDAWHLGLVAPTEAAEYLEAIRRSGRGGVSRFEKWLSKTSARERPSQSGFELDVVDAIRRAGLPEPQRQQPLRLPSGELIHIDLAWPEVRLGVEPGHSWWHGGDLRARADAARDRSCDIVGWRIVRYDEEARSDLGALGRELAQIYAARRDQVLWREKRHF